MRVIESAVGSNHPDLAVTLADYADALRAAGQKAEARAAAERAGAIRKSFAAQDGSATVNWREMRR